MQQRRPAPHNPAPGLGLFVPTRPRWGRPGCSRGGQSHTNRPRGWILYPLAPGGAAWVQQRRPVPHKPAPGLGLFVPTRPRWGRFGRSRGGQPHTTRPQGWVFLYPPAPGGGGLGAAEAASPTQTGPRAVCFCAHPPPVGAAWAQQRRPAPHNPAPGLGVFVPTRPRWGRFGRSSQGQSPTNWLQGWFFMPTRPRWGRPGCSRGGQPHTTRPQGWFFMPTRPRWGGLGAADEASPTQTGAGAGFVVPTRSRRGTQSKRAPVLLYRADVLFYSCL